MAKGLEVESVVTGHRPQHAVVQFGDVPPVIYRKLICRDLREPLATECHDERVEMILWRVSTQLYLVLFRVTIFFS